MKFAILGDTHFGMRNDSNRFHSYCEKFYDNVFFPYLKEHNISTVVQLGDLFDRRKYINFLSLNRAKKYFFNPLKDNNIHLHTLLGNHDIFWRESLEVNSTGLVLGEYNNVTLHSKPNTINLGAVTIDMIPWMCDENYDEVVEYIQNSKSDLCAGHFEIAGFAMYRGMESHDGISKNLFSNYHTTLSGHYHTKSSQDNITYVGTPMEITWQDYNDPKGFHIFDDQTMTLEFVKNPYRIFEKIIYNDSEENVAYIDNLDVNNFVEKYIKLIVVEKNNHHKFDSLLNSLYNSDIYELKIIEDYSEFETGIVEETINLENTLDVLDNYVDSVDTTSDKQKIKSFMRELYLEATNLEIV